MIYVDADACPVKDEVIKVAERLGVAAVFVSNSRLRIYQTELISQSVVSGGFDAADDWIAERAASGDVVVTADILLAERCVKSGALVVGHNGHAFTPANIGPAIAMRALKQDLRDMGEIGGGNPPFSRADRSRFLQELDRMLRRAARG